MPNSTNQEMLQPTQQQQQQQSLNMEFATGSTDNLESTIDNVALGNVFALPGPVLRRKTKREDESDNDSSDYSTANSASKKSKYVSNKNLINTQIDELVKRINFLETENKKKDDLINSLTLAVNDLNKKYNEHSSKIIETSISSSNDSSNPNNISRPLFSDLLKSKESINLDYDTKKNIYNLTNELKEQEIKKNNIIIHGLSYSTDPKTTYSEDLDKSIIEKLLIKSSLNFDKIKRFKRLIKKDNSNILTAPIIIQFNNIDDKFKLLKNLKSIKQDNLYKNIFINNDLTNAQRVILKDLIILRNKLNSDENTKDDSINYYYTIINNKIEKKFKTK